MPEQPDIMEAPDERPAPQGSRYAPLSGALGVFLSLIGHALIVFFLFFTITQREEEIGSGGGTGWADQIEITASRESSSGLQGDPGSTAENEAQERRAIDVSMVYAPPPPPPPPEPEEYLPEEEEEEIEPEEVEEEPEPEPEPEIIEEALVEDEIDDEQVSDETALEGVRANVAQEALVDTAAEGEDAGEGGLSDTLAGSHIGALVRGLGSGNADTGRPGAYVPGAELRELLNGWTLRGSNGFADGSTTYENDRRRQEIPWRVYYRSNGQLVARWERYGSAYAHGPRAMRWYERNGTWTIEGDVLCQRIRSWGSNGTTCFEVHRDGDHIAMYYSHCRGVARCYPGRLGPEGIMVEGRDLRD